MYILYGYEYSIYFIWFISILRLYFVKTNPANKITEEKAFFIRLQTHSSFSYQTKHSFKNAQGVKISYQHKKILIYSPLKCDGGSLTAFLLKGDDGKIKMFFFSFSTKLTPQVLHFYRQWW